MTGYLIVFVGAGIGGTLRQAVNMTALRVGSLFRWHTMVINISGSLVMGLMVGWLAFRGDASQYWRLFATTGIIGGYTTFSAFSLDVALLVERDDLGQALLDVLGSVLLSIAALFAGPWTIRGLAP